MTLNIPEPSRRQLESLYERIKKERIRQTENREALFDLRSINELPELPPLKVHSNTALLEEFFNRFHSARNVTHLLPLIFSLQGKPFSINEHFHFEPAFRTVMSKYMTFKTGRQVGKSMSVASASVIRAATIPYFNQLYITPLFETTRRFSTTYVSPLIEESPIRGLLIDTKCNRSVLQRSFKNRSIMFFSYALVNADRTRGLNCSAVNVDEVQDVDPGLIPIIQQVTAGSPDYDMMLYTGTPKTLDTALQKVAWEKSSQAEWHTKCTSCNFENIAAKDYHLDKMTGPQFVRREISRSMPGIVCAKCQRPIFPHNGRWIHHKHENLELHPGYHVPQQILPLHYAKGSKWRALLNKRELAPHTYYNEVCGESYDVGAKLITQTDLINASDSDRPNSLEYAAKTYDRYVARLITVDWGGGGETGESRTVIAAMGMKPDGLIEVVWAVRLLEANDYPAEVRLIFRAMRAFHATHVVHDYGGAGDIREHLMVSAGLPLQQIVPVAYVGTLGAGIMRHVPEQPSLSKRAYYQLFKARAFTLTCQLIRFGRLRFFKYDYVDAERPGLINNFMALVEHTIENAAGRNVYTIRKVATTDPDDFANAVNIGACSLFEMFGEWPNLAKMANIQVTPEMIAMCDPDDPDWEYDYD